MYRRRLALFALLVLVLGCSATTSDEKIGQHRQLARVLPDTGFIPYPVLVENGQVVRDEDGNLVPGWDGTIVELMAADALSQCSPWESSPAPFPAVSLRYVDLYLEYIAGKMAANACGAWNVTGEFSVAENWFTQRTTYEDCNVETSSGKSKLLAAEPDPRTHAENSGYLIPSVAAGLQLTGPATTEAIAEAQQMLFLAPMNLCLAERLRARMVTADALVAAGRDQRELLEVIRERAQMAVFQYALLGLAIANPDPAPDVALTRYHSLAVLRAWARTAGFGPLTFAGQDFSQALRIHIEATRELSQLLLRSGSARSDLGELRNAFFAPDQPTVADEDWGAPAWRRRLVNALHGGDPLGREGLNDDATRPYGTNGGFFSPFVKVDVQAAEVWEALGLMREADAGFLAVDNSPFSDPGNFNFSFNVTRTADFMYRKIEAFVRTTQCGIDDPTNAACPVGPGDPSIPAQTAFEDSLLWQKYRIKPEHILALSKMLTEAAPRIGPRSGGDGTQGSVFDERYGALHFSGQHEHLLNVPDAPGRWFHLDPDFTTIALANSERDTAVMRYGPLLPDSLNVALPAQSQGFFMRWRWLGSTDFRNRTRPEQFRFAGSASALTAARDALLTGRKWADTQTYSAAYFADIATQLKLVEAAVGKRTFAVRPVNVVENFSATSGNPSICQEWGVGTQNCDLLVMGLTADGQNYRFELSVVTEPSDPFQDLVAYWTELRHGGVIGTAARDPEFQSLTGFTRADLDAAPRIKPKRVDAFPALGLEKRVYEFTAPNDSPFTLSFGESTLLLSTCPPAATDYRMLADNLNLPIGRDQIFFSSEVTPDRSAFARYGGFDGDFGRMNDQAFAVLSNNWSQPAFDAFGLPINWVPPPDPALTTLADNGQAVVGYLNNAKVAALEATQAVAQAIDTLLEEEKDNTIVAAAQQRADAVKANQQKAFCGESGATCNTNVAVLNLETDSRFPVLNCASVSGTAFFELCTAAENAIVTAAPSAVRVLSLVNQKLADPAVPAFDEYRGGTLQSIAVEQWTALDRLRGLRETIRTQLNSLIVRYNQAVAIADAAQASADAAVQTAAFNCSPNVFSAANDAGLSCSDAPGTLSAGTDGSWSYSFNCDMAAWSMGPWLAQVSACNTSQIQVPAAQAQANAAAMGSFVVIQDAWAIVANARTAAAEVFRQIQLASVAMASAQTQAAIAQSEADLDAELAPSTAFSRLGTARRYHHFELFRARALLENARRHALAARRAIEANFVVNLSTLHGDEPFVAAPAVWADEVYEYDLDTPAAVGLQRAPAQEGAINPNRLADYVTNLENFVLGYSVNRPTAIAKQDAEIVSLAGPDQRETVEVDASGTLGEVLARQSQAWQYFCEDSQTWIQHPAIGEIPATSDVMTACDGAAPTIARRSFTLDAWGRLDGDRAQPPYEARHNVRWRRIATNVVGTGIRDCTLSSDPLNCYAESFLRYDLRHVGPMWVTNFEEQWRALGHPLGRIEGGKALAVEEWLDPVRNGWTQPFVSAVGRTEFFTRPYGGAYEIELHLTPDVRLDRIERIQLLTESDYWVAQR